MNILGSFTSLIIRVVVVLLAISVHEASHGFVAFKLGDYTAKSMGRISINPFKHLDPIGALCMLSFGFGWAQPVMVNPYNFKKPKRDMALVSLAGPVSNFIMAFIMVFLDVALFKLFAYINLPANFFVDLLFRFLRSFALLNIGLGVFNLLPIPPLDGSKIFLPLLPERLYYDIMRYERFGWLILIVALGLGVLDPIMGKMQMAILNLFIFIVGGGI